MICKGRSCLAYESKPLHIELMPYQVQDLIKYVPKSFVGIAIPKREEQITLAFAQALWYRLFYPSKTNKTLLMFVCM